MGSLLAFCAWQRTTSHKNGTKPHCPFPSLPSLCDQSGRADCFAPVLERKAKNAFRRRLVEDLKSRLCVFSCNGFCLDDRLSLVRLAWAERASAPASTAKTFRPSCSSPSPPPGGIPPNPCPGLLPPTTPTLAQPRCNKVNLNPLGGVGFGCRPALQAPQWEEHPPGPRRQPRRGASLRLL